MVECDLAKVEVAGSNPVSRSTLRSGDGERASDGKPTFRRRVSTSRGAEVEQLNDVHVRPTDTLSRLAFRRGRITPPERVPAGAVAKW